MIPYMSPVFYKDRVLRTNSLMFELTNFSKLHYFRLFHFISKFQLSYASNLYHPTNEVNHFTAEDGEILKIVLRIMSVWNMNLFHVRGKNPSEQ